MIESKFLWIESERTGISQSSIAQNPELNFDCSLKSLNLGGLS